MYEHEIKLIALDLDGTTLNSEKQLTERTKKAIEAAIEKGVSVVIATGRAYSALPGEVFEIKGMKYIMTSNGASITDITKGEKIYSNCIEAKALESTVSLLRKYDFMLEFFIKGVAYVEQEIYDKIAATTFAQSHKTYITETRKPVKGLLDFALLHKEIVENINVNFENQDDRSMMRDVLATLENVTITTSFDHNLEIGGFTTSKADAVKVICNELGICDENVMACGDSPNDGAMLRAAGFSVAMKNAKEELKETAKYVTSTNDEDGVAEAIEKFVLV